jgi:DNA-binding NarL/FixJ family response regulator
MKALRILLADDHQAVRNGIRALIAPRPEWTICGEAADGLEAVEKSRELLPDAVLMDISMSRMDGLQATQVIRRELPKTKVIIVSQNDPAVVRRQAAEVKAHGFIAKADIGKDLESTLDRIFAVSAGHTGNMQADRLVG